MSVLDCKKVKYNSFQEAFIILKQIKSDPNYKKKEKKENRIYKCPLCSGYHITSISQQEITRIREISKKKAKIRIMRAVEYWERKLGINKKGS